ncbi:Hypothetical predicted protein, partial [Paramuricea clavata]
MSCPAGWMNLVSSCFYFSTNKAIWSQARASCRKLGGDLAVLSNHKENNAVWNIVKQKQLGNPFIGLVRNQDKKFYTVQGVKPSYINWYSGEPNNPHLEQCGQLLIHHNGQWNDVSCNSKYHFICQIQLIK